jgi:hypothetical protein
MKEIQMIAAFGFYKPGEVYLVSDQSAENLINKGLAQPTVDKKAPSIRPFAKVYNTKVSQMVGDVLRMNLGKMGLPADGKVDDLKKRLLDDFKENGIDLALFSDDEILEFAEKMGIEALDGLVREEIEAAIFENDPDLRAKASATPES